jgi:hypothetical protein
MAKLPRHGKGESVPSYVMPPYWQCMKCLFVTHDPKLTQPGQRRCQHCNTPAPKAYTWPGSSGDVYRAVLHNMKSRDDWIAISMRAIILCSLAELHESRLIWSILTRQGCPGCVAASIEKTVKRQDYLKLFGELIGKKAKEFRRCSSYTKFWDDLDKLREFRNDFIHREPDKSNRGPEEIPPRLGDVIQSVDGDMETAFQELSNNVLASISPST